MREGLGGRATEGPWLAGGAAFHPGPPRTLSPGTLQPRLLGSPGSCWQPGDQREPKGQPVHASVPLSLSGQPPPRYLEIRGADGGLGQPYRREAGDWSRKGPATLFRGLQPGRSARGGGRGGAPAPCRVFQLPLSTLVAPNPSWGAPVEVCKSGLRRGALAGHSEGAGHGGLREHLVHPFSPGETRTRAPRAPPTW